MKHFIHADSGITLVSQLTWQVLDPLGASFFGHTLIPELIESGARMSATYKNGPEINIGITPAVFDETKKHQGQPMSFAVLVAQHKSWAGRSCIVFMHKDGTEESSGLVCAMIAGNVVLDDQFALADIDGVYQDFANMCERSNRNFEIHGDIAPQGAAISEHLTLAELLSTSKKNTGSAVKLLRSDKPVLVVVLLALLTILVFAALAVWDWYRDGVTAKMRALSQHMQSPAYLYEQSVATLLAKPVWIVPVNIQDIAQAVGSFPASLAKWNLTSLVCEENDCTAKWQSAGGTYADFQDAAYPTWGKLSLSNSATEAHGDLKTLQHSATLNVTGGLLPAMDQWPKFDDYLISSGVEIQQLKDFGWLHRLGPATQQAIPRSISPIAVAQHPQAIHAMPWSMTRQSWNQAKTILPLFPPHATLNRFEIHINEKDLTVTFTASGLVYVQK